MKMDVVSAYPIEMRIRALPGVAIAELTCSSAPCQVEGTLTDGRHFYLRTRSSYTGLGVGDSPGGAVQDWYENSERMPCVHVDIDNHCSDHVCCYDGLMTIISDGWPA